MQCVYCEKEMKYSDSVYDKKLEGRICRDCDHEIENDELINNV